MDTANEPLVIVEVADDSRIARVVLNRPDRRNALTGPMATELADAIEDINTRDDVSVIVLSGAGGAFCSGLDLREFNADPQPDWVRHFGSEWRRAHRALFDSDKIVIAALERYAINGGAALAWAADLLVVGQTAFVQVGEIQQGMAAPMNLAWLRLRHSEAITARIVLLGDRIVGADLVGLGVAYEAVEDHQVIAAAGALAERLAAHDPMGVRRIKTSLRRTGLDHDAATWFEQAFAADPVAGRTIAPIAAIDR